MNTNGDLLNRLLRLFPVRFIKAYFNAEGSIQDEIIPNIIQHNTQVVIRNFSVNNFNNTKQHVYFFSIDRNFNRNNFDPDDFPLEILDETVSQNSYQFKCLPVVDFNTVVTNPFEEATIRYFQPTIITIRRRQVIIQCTILEKNLNYLFGADRKVVDVTKTNDEEHNINSIKDYFSQDYGVIPTDLNNGIKHLWDTDVIDSKYAKWKKARSSATEAMDEGYTLKTQYPDVYENLMNSPLNKTIFKYLRNDDLFCSHFTADATKGQLSIPLFPDTEHQINNIINEILSNN